MAVAVTGAALAGASCLLQSATLPGPALVASVTVGEFALQTHDLLKGDTPGYRPWFEPGSWQGDLIEYAISKTGAIHTDVNVGANPPVAGSAGGCQRPASGCWSARAAFHASGADDPTGHYWQQRNLFTGNNGQVDFSWQQLSPAQRSLLDAATAARTVTQPGAWDSAVLNYIRGERLHEQQHARLPGSAGRYHDRSSVLGDIPGTPVYIGPPRERLGHVAGYVTFSAAGRNRPGRIAVGANDGMLHVFDAADGAEIYAYIPSMLLADLGGLAGQQSPWQHRDYVAGELSVASAELGSSNWRTVLAGGGGPGFAGLYALDVTDPAFTHDKLLFEKNGGVWGHVFGQPRIGRVGGPAGNATWYVFSGNGYQQSPLHPTALMLIDLETLAETAITLPGVTGGLSAPALLSTDDDDSVELVFAGDRSGDLWMFEIDAGNPHGSKATRLYRGNPQRPVIHAPAIAKHPSAPGYLVYFAGSPAPGSGVSGSVQAIRINTADSAMMRALPYTDSHLLTRAFSATTTGTATGTALAVRMVSDHSPVLYHCPAGVSPCPALHSGWRTVLPGCGEQPAGRPRIRAGRLQFTTTINKAACASGNHTGDNWMMSLDYVQGHDNGRAVFDINHDHTIDHRDSLQSAGLHQAPVGIHIGSGRVSTPLHLRVDSHTDRVVFNRLLPLVAVIPPPATGGGITAPGMQPGPPVAAGGQALPNATPAPLLPVMLPSPGPGIAPGRRSWTDNVQ
jgi:Tfp pilus tip-associated adhesin PilY1